MKIAANGDITVNIEDLKKIIKDEVKEQTGNIYPVGSIYISTQATNPSEFLGGTWERYGEGRTLISAGTSDQTFIAGETGGESKHTLTTEEMPSHFHNGIFSGTVGAKSSAVTLNTGTYGYSLSWKGTHDSSTLGGGNGVNELKTNYEGGSQAHNNLQPYIVTYMWKRVA